MSLWKKVVFAAITAIAVLVILEIVLALFGVTPVLYHDDPYVGFAGNVRLFVEENASGVMVTAENKLKWFNQQRFARKKPADTYRIFCMGGSTTYGRPYTDPVSFSGWLREMLPVADPSRRWEVINAGGISYGSYRLAVVMEELLQYEPDLFIIYTGHNEFLERRTYQDIIERPRAVTGAAALLSRTRLFTVMQKMKPSGGEQRVADKADQLLPAEVEEILTSAMGPEEYRRDDTQQQRVIDHFRFNLNRLIDIAQSAGAETILVTPAANLRDCSPFKSEHLDNLSGEDKARFKTFLERAQKDQQQGQLKEAMSSLDEAAEIDGRHADLHYRRGQLLFELQRFDQARAAFQKALDEDICSLRALSATRTAITEIAALREVPLLDFAAEIERDADHQIPGAEQFLDHVHLNIEGYRDLATDLIDTMHNEKILRKSSDWNDAAIEGVAKIVEGRLDKQAHAVALRNLAKVFSWAGKMTEAERMAQQAASMMGDDAESQYVLGMGAESRGDTVAALKHYRKAVELAPDFTPAQNNLGNLLAKQDRFEEAIRHYRMALESDPNDAVALANLGNAMASKGDLEQAVALYRRALEIKPDHVRAHYNLGKTLHQQGELDEALTHYQLAIQINPNYAPAYNNIGNMHASRGEIDQAISHFRQAVERDPGYVSAHSNLGNALHAAGKLDEAIDHCRRALQLDPTYAEAYNNLGNALLAQGRTDEAMSHYRSALKHRPDWADAEYNLGVALIRLQRFDDAIVHFQSALRLKADYANAHNNLGIVLMLTNRYDEALVHLRKALALKDDWAMPMSGIAWILATHPDRSIRDPAEAVRLGNRAAELTNYQDPGTLQTLIKTHEAAGNNAEANRVRQRLQALSAPAR